MVRRPFFRLSDLVLIRSIFLLYFRSRSAYYCEKNRSQKIFPTVKILISKKTVSTCNSGDSDYNESRDRTGRVQERIKPIPGKRYGTKKKINGRLPSSCMRHEIGNFCCMPLCSQQNREQTRATEK